VTTALASLRQILASARARASLVPGLGELITGIETHLVTEAHRLTVAADVAADAMRQVSELRLTVADLRTRLGVLERRPTANASDELAQCLENLRRRIEALEPGPLGESPGGSI
jgi:hypothetical protein